MTRQGISQRWRRAAEYAGAMLMVPVLGLLANSLGAQILKGEIPDNVEKGSLKTVVDLVDDLLEKGVWIVMILAPLGVAWGAGAMIFGGRSGPQIMGSSIVAVVLVGSAKFVAG